MKPILTRVENNMKHFILFLIVFLVSSQTTVTNRKSDREHDGFVGPVKKVFEYWTPISGSPTHQTQSVAK
jgi:hypothetical protein